MTSKVLAMILTLLVAITLLILLWYGFGKLVASISKMVDDIIRGFKSMLCSNVPILGDICRLFFGG